MVEEREEAAVRRVAGRYAGERSTAALHVVQITALDWQDALMGRRPFALAGGVLTFNDAQGARRGCLDWLTRFTGSRAEVRTLFFRMVQAACKTNALSTHGCTARDRPGTQ